MRVHVLQHVPFEGPAEIGDWFTRNGHVLTITRMYLGETLPAPDDFDFLVIMGGPMGVGDSIAYPWLVSELQFIEQAIGKNKFMLGVCLGAQLITSALGARVEKQPYREIGWFPVNIMQQELPAYLSDVFPDSLEVFHWHGDRFEIPQGAKLFASSKACSNQAFIYNDRALALQFHIETTHNAVAGLVENCRDELDGTTYVQSEQEILASRDNFYQANQVLSRLLANMTAEFVRSQ
jgi:GMP synthase (glutamine-hydrolysing)